MPGVGGAGRPPGGHRAATGRPYDAIGAIWWQHYHWWNG
jgi:hypothetical protein